MKVNITTITVANNQSYITHTPCLMSANTLNCCAVPYLSMNIDIISNRINKTVVIPSYPMNNNIIRRIVKIIVKRILLSLE